MLKRVGVYPLRDHYYEPLFNDGHLSVDLAQPRKLPGIDFRLAEQIAFLKTLRFQDEF
ncbi:hypothetical protein [Tabrizicola sp. TH137]|uniref:hypothetical protein n=1 Tax=Tabrizicola sp. TH137 TaxID=2067452 RepID=UPI0013045C09|nr:hypothetical protein [Tabrizicola sp. TH137]